MTSDVEGLLAQLQHLRHLYMLLAAVPDSRQHDELIERTRVAIAEVRRSRTAIGERPYPTGGLMSLREHP